MRLLLIVLVILTLGLLACAAPERVCSLDQSSMHFIKCWGDCPNQTSTCHIRWRATGSEDPWESDHRDSRDRNAERDAELEYGCFCE